MTVENFCRNAGATYGGDAVNNVITPANLRAQCHAQLSLRSAHKWGGSELWYDYTATAAYTLAGGYYLPWSPVPVFGTHLTPDNAHYTVLCIFWPTVTDGPAEVTGGTGKQAA